MAAFRDLLGLVLKWWSSTTFIPEIATGAVYVQITPEVDATMSISPSVAAVVQPTPSEEGSIA